MPRLCRLVIAIAVAGPILLAPMAPGAQRLLARLPGAAGGVDDGGAVPKPAAIIGWEPCADYKLATYEQIADYFRALDAASERLELSTIGTTVEGRGQLMAVISSADNMRTLARWQDTSRRLATARGLTNADARQLAAVGKAVVWIDFGLHANEVAHAQAAPLLAWQMVADESAEARFIRDNVVLILVPNMNPDGTTRMANWYRQQLGTRFETSEPPWLSHTYAGHDNNRDWFMFNLPESRNVARQLYAEWFPQIVYDHHQPGLFPARIFIPPFQDPINPNIPAAVNQGVAEMGAAMARRFASEKKTGVISRVLYDSWWNGGMRSAPAFHNMVGILTEAAHASATPATHEATQFPRMFPRGPSTTEPSANYPDPWKGGAWRLRDACDYMLTASMAVLDNAAARRAHWLYGMYEMGRDAIAAGRRETYVIPARQWDPNASIKLVNALRWGGIDVTRSMRAFSTGGRRYAAGSFLVQGAQAFRAHATDLLNPQRYPERNTAGDTSLERPYDITGWTLSHQMGVRVDRVTPSLSVPAAPVAFAPLPPSRLEGSGAFQVIDPRSNEAYVAVNRLLAARARVYRSVDPMPILGTVLPPGAFLVAGDAMPHVADLGLVVRAMAQAPRRTQGLRTPRIGLYQAWGGNADEGWTRWLLEQFEFPYETVRDQVVRAGDLRSTFDVIVLPDATYEAMRSGLDRDSVPEEYAGGMTTKGIANLAAFVTDGGTLVTLGRASDLPLAGFRLPIRDVTSGLADSQFLVPGSLLRITSDARHPVAYGMPAEAAAFFSHNSAFQVDESTDPDRRTGAPALGPVTVRTIVRYPATSLLLSGWARGESVLRGQIAALEASVGQGRVVVLGFRVQHRGQSHGTFRLLFNAILMGGAAPLARTTELE